MTMQQHPSNPILELVSNTVRLQVATASDQARIEQVAIIIDGHYGSRTNKVKQTLNLSADQFDRLLMLTRVLEHERAIQLGVHPDPDASH